MKNELEIFLEQFDKLTLDSRQISKNTVFIAYPGMKFDGRDFIEQAVNNGANGIVFESENYKKKLNLQSIDIDTFKAEHFDAIYKEMNGENRDQWIGMLDFKVLIHRSFSWTSLIMAGWIYYKSKKENFKVDHIKTILILIITLGASGALLYYLALPMLLQPLHLLISSFVLVLLFQSLIRINKVK